MNLNKLDKRITIQKTVKASDNVGGFTTTWADIVTVWAAIWPVSAREQVRDKQTVGEISHRVRIRFRRAVRSTYRIQYKRRYFSILGIVNPDEDNTWLDILCKEVI